MAFNNPFKGAKGFISGLKQRGAQAAEDWDTTRGNIRENIRQRRTQFGNEMDVAAKNIPYHLQSMGRGARGAFDATLGRAGRDFYGVGKDIAGELGESGLFGGLGVAKELYKGYRDSPLGGAMRNLFRGEDGVSEEEWNEETDPDPLRAGLVNEQEMRRLVGDYDTGYSDESGTYDESGSPYSNPYQNYDRGEEAW